MLGGSFAFGTTNAVAVGGGSGNTVGGDFTTIAGGQQNRAGTPEIDTDAINGATVGGGIGNFAEGITSTVVGGLANLSAGRYSVSGGSGNDALGESSTAFGAVNCAGGNNSVALGVNAKVRAGNTAGAPSCNGIQNSGDADGDEGTFVWSDTVGGNFISSGSDQFLVRAFGGVGINTNESFLLTGNGVHTELAIKGVDDGPADLLLVSGQPPAVGVGSVTHRLVSSGTTTSDVALRIAREVNALGVPKVDLATFGSNGRFQVFFDSPIKPTAGGWASPSDERLKQAIRPLGAGILDRLLSLRGVTYEYRSDAPNGYYTRGTHTGFVAQQVERVFPEWVSTDDAGYRLVGPQGFEALAVEALRELREESRAQIAQRDATIASLQASNDTLSRRLDAMESNLMAIGNARTQGPALAEVSAATQR